MEHVIFVDDEPRILEGLQRTLRRMRREWDMRFALGGAEALRMLEEKPASIVVSDMKMPGMDGAELLSQVKHLYPDTIRVILSGHSDIELVMKAVGPSHQYLSKPCDPDVLEQTIKRAQALKELLNNPHLAKLVAQIDTLPSMPVTYQNIIQCLQKPDATLVEVGRIINTDIGMTAKILKLVNSAYFGLAKVVGNIEVAASLLGLDTIMSLVLAHEVFSQYDETMAGLFDADELLSYTMRTGAAVKVIAKQEKLDKKTSDFAYTAAMLHDCGKLVLAVEMPDAYGQVITHAGGQNEFSESTERELLGATHAEVGAYLIGLWGLPNVVIDAVAYHEKPSQCPVCEFGALGAVHVASRMALNPDVDDPEKVSPALDMEYLTALDQADRWPQWQDLWRQAQECDG